MTERTKDLESQALQLPADARARLAERLLASLDCETDSQIDELWLAESERRLDELESGRSTVVDAAQVIADARSKLR